jgi:hypothetical protein
LLLNLVVDIELVGGVATTTEALEGDTKSSAFSRRFFSAIATTAIVTHATATLPITIPVIKESEEPLNSSMEAFTDAKVDVSERSSAVG